MKFIKNLKKIGKNAYNGLKIHLNKLNEVQKLKSDLNEYQFIKNVNEVIKKNKEKILKNSKNKFLKLIYERINLIVQDKLKYNNDFYKKIKLIFQ